MRAQALGDQETGLRAALLCDGTHKKSGLPCGRPVRHALEVVAPSFMAAGGHPHNPFMNPCRMGRHHGRPADL